MAKAKPSTAMPLTGTSTQAERDAANRTHHSELIGHTLDSAAYGGHGHAVGSGPTGKMVPNDSVYQGKPHAYIPQAALNVTTKDGGATFDDPSAKDYGTADAGDE
jgi:hypothetical protein